MRPHDDRKVTSRVIQVASTLGISFVILSGCSMVGPLKSKPEQQAVTQASVVQAVKVVKISRQQIAKVLEIGAKARSSQEIDAVSVTGGEVVQILKKRGDLVQQGEIIAKLESKALLEGRNKAELAVKSAKDAINSTLRTQADNRTELANSLRKMEAELDDLTKKLNKAKNDYDRGITSKSKVGEAEASLEQYRLDYEQAKKQKPDNSVAALELQLSNAETALQQADEAIANLQIRSPLTGIVTDLPITAGMTVQSRALIGRVEKVDPIKITAMLNAEAVKHVGQKTELTYQARGSEKKTGKITYLANVVNAETNAYEMNMEVPNPDFALKPGMDLVVQLTNATEQTVVSVPQNSILTSGTDSYVFILEGNIAMKRKVQLGRSNDLYMEVVSGVQEGELVIVSGQMKLQDQDTVMLKE